MLGGLGNHTAQVSTIISPGVAAALNMELELSALRDDDDDDSYDEQQELASLVTASVNQNRRRQIQNTAQATLQKSRTPQPSLARRIFGNRQSLRLIMAIAFTFMLFYLLNLFCSPSKGTKSDSGKGSRGGKSLFRCPSIVKRNEYPVPFNATWTIMDKDLNVWIKTFRERETDSWGHTYNQIKSAMSDWKSSRFAPFLTANSTIYNVASGVGLDSFMTLEILQEKNGISGLTIHGNDIEKENLATTQVLLNKLLPSIPGKYGIFCQADSRFLHEFLVADTFDLVFTGRIPPLLNPFNWTDKPDDLSRAYASLCAVSTSSRKQKLLQHYQSLQDQWYAIWVNEMIRIAKPGAPVIIEQVSLPMCQNRFDSGGVLQSFWNSTPSIVEQVQLSSLHLEPDKLIPQRYHVFMKKKKREA